MQKVESEPLQKQVLGTHPKFLETPLLRPHEAHSSLSPRNTMVRLERVCFLDLKELSRRLGKHLIMLPQDTCQVCPVYNHLTPVSPPHPGPSRMLHFFIQNLLLCS